ncbi:hypothetical protein N6H14_07290 [Paenibacillus sp. CC-CFT747]|nr:hypothetical protein N6H14_07290 [Paenibacillus sp. CC-CFT747]
MVYLKAIGSGLALILLLVPLVRRWALRLGYVDRPGDGKYIRRPFL